ncbi:unnamed protein product [Prunus brigantina]
MRTQPGSKFACIRGQANVTAHRLAQFVLSCDVRVEWFEEPLDIIQDVIFLDVCNRGQVLSPPFSHSQSVLRMTIGRFGVRYGNTILEAALVFAHILNKNFRGIHVHIPVPILIGGIPPKPILNPQFFFS